MTLISAMLCTDGVVVAADGAATFSPPHGAPTIMQTTKKLVRVGDDVILGLSGPGSLAQSYELLLSQKLAGSGGKASFRSLAKAREDLSALFWGTAKGAWERAETVKNTIGAQAAYQEVSHSTIVALPINEAPHFISFSEQCHPEHGTAQLSFVSIGSGQSIADPLLAFISYLLFDGSQPTVGEAIPALIWALDRAIKMAPGSIAQPIQVFELSVAENGKWQALELTESEIDDHRSAIASIAADARTAARRTFAPEDGEEIPSR